MEPAANYTLTHPFKDLLGLITNENSNKMLGALFEYAYLATPATLPDISQQSVRDSFEFLNMTANGSGPTGSQPLIYLHGVSNLMAGTNFGNGGNFARLETFTAL